MIFENSLVKLVNEIIKENHEENLILQPTITKIETYLLQYNDVKIGKTANIEDRFDTYYKSAGYLELIPITKCRNKRIMDHLEEDLIEHFGNRVSNSQVGGGNKKYTNNYWIYIVVK